MNPFPAAAQGTTKRKRMIGLAKVGVSGILLTLVWRRVVGGGDVAGALGRVDISGLAAAVLVFGAGQVMAAARLQFILTRLGRRLTRTAVLRAHFIGIWFNQILPTGFGGDVVKLLLLRGSGGTLRTTRAVLLARAFGMLALLLASVLLTPFYAAVMNRPEPMYAIAAVALICLVGFGALLAVSGKTGRFTRTPRPVRFLILMLRDARRLGTGASFFEQLITSVLLVLSVVTTFFLLGHALGHPITLPTCMVAVPPIILSMHLPLSYGGWGIREVGAVALLPLGGVPAETAFLMSVLYGLVILVWGGVGLILWQVPVRGRRLTVPGAPAPVVEP